MRISILFVSLLAEIAMGEQPYSYKTLKNTGVLFEDISKSFIYNDQWTIITTINMSRIDLWKQYLVSGQQALRDICNKIEEIQLNRSCILDVESVKRTATRIVQTLDKFDLNDASRLKRSIIDGVGKLSKFLFGTMDQDDADEIHQRLKNLESDDSQNLQLIKEQVSLIKSNYETNFNNLKEIEISLHDTNEYISKVINSVNSTIAKVVLDTNILSGKIKLEEITNSIISKFYDIEDQANDLFRIITALTDKHLHPMLLSYKQIAQLMKNVPVNCPLSSIVQNPFIMQQIAKVESIHSHNTIFCKISIPLIQKDIFSLRRIYRLPIVHHNNISVHFKLSHDYLLVDDGASKFIHLYDSDLKLSETMTFNITQTIFICQLKFPIYTAPDEHCLLLLYKGWSEAKEVCDTVPILNESNTLFKMVTDNSCLYTLHSETTTEIDCINFKTKIKLVGKGILTLKPGCRGIFGNIILPTTNTFFKNISIQSVELVPNFNEDLKQYDLYPYSQNSPMLTVIDHKGHKPSLKLSHDKLQSVLRNIEQVGKERELRSFKATQTSHTILLSILAISFVIGVAIIFKLLVRRKRQTNRNNPYVPRVNVLNPSSLHITHPESSLEMRENPTTLSSDSFIRENAVSIPVNTPVTKQIIQGSSKSKISDFEIV